MACILPHWREAATLMLCRKRLIDAGSKICHGSKFLKGLKIEETSTRNVTKIKANFKESDFDYDFLYIERSSKSTFMPSLYVYPGGIAEDSDFNPDWFHLFKKANCDFTNVINAANNQCTGIVPPMLTRERLLEFGHVPPDIAFRISAIRETFEETGVLLAKSINETSVAAERFTNFDINMSTLLNLPYDESRKWRKYVSSNPLAFIELCDSLNVLPDIWSLYEWTNWLTPVFQSIKNFLEKKQERRYDTIFYMCFTDTDEALKLKEDNVEAVKTALMSPFEVLQKFKENAKQVAAPQVYENSRLLNIEKFDDLVKYACERSKFRPERYLPCLSIYNDGVVIAFPGDELYPNKPDPCNGIDVMMHDKSRSDVITSHPAANRHLPSDKIFHFSCDLSFNIPLHGRHLAPVTDLEIVDPTSPL